MYVPIASRPNRNKARTVALLGPKTYPPPCRLHGPSANPIPPAWTSFPKLSQTTCKSAEQFPLFVYAACDFCGRSEKFVRVSMYRLDLKAGGGRYLCRI